MTIVLELAQYVFSFIPWAKSVSQIHLYTGTWEKLPSSAWKIYNVKLQLTVGTGGRPGGLGHCVLSLAQAILQLQPRLPLWALDVVKENLKNYWKPIKIFLIFKLNLLRWHWLMEWCVFSVKKYYIYIFFVLIRKVDMISFNPLKLEVEVLQWYF